MGSWHRWGSPGSGQRHGQQTHLEARKEARTPQLGEGCRERHPAQLQTWTSHRCTWGMSPPKLLGLSAARQEMISRARRGPGSGEAGGGGRSPRTLEPCSGGPGRLWTPRSAGLTHPKAHGASLKHAPSQPPTPPITTPVLSPCFSSIIQTIDTMPHRPVYPACTGASNIPHTDTAYRGQTHDARPDPPYPTWTYTPAARSYTRARTHTHTLLPAPHPPKEPGGV